jgi:hypothetical protein
VPAPSLSRTGSGPGAAVTHSWTNTRAEIGEEKPHIDQLGKTLSRAGLPLAGALLIAAIAAAGAQAQIHPNNTTITGTADDPRINHEGAEIVCDTATAVGTTGTDQFHVNLELHFFDCQIEGLGAVPVSCSDAAGPDGEFGTVRWEETDSLNDFGVFDQLNEDFLCEVTITGVCTISIAEQELPSNVDGSPGRQQANLLDEGTANAAIDVVVDAEATNNNPVCGPAQGDAGFAGVYDLDTPVTFD